MFLEKGIEEFGKNQQAFAILESCAVVVERLWMFLELSKSPMVAINPFPLVKDISSNKKDSDCGVPVLPVFLQ